MRGMDLWLPNFFWDTLYMYRNHWNGLQAGPLEHPTWPIDTTGLLSIYSSSFNVKHHAVYKFILETLIRIV